MGLLPDQTYTLKTRPQKISLRRFGSLVNHVLPVRLNPDGWLFSLINRYYTLTDCVECYQGCGRALMDGVMLNNQFIGTGQNPQVRLLSDYGSSLYVIETENDAQPDENVS